MINSNKTYDIAISYASEDKPFVGQVAEILKRKGVKVFYDDYELVRMWGNNLVELLKDIYSNQTYFVVMFISKAYADKMYTNHERRSALDTALKTNYEYILPARFDDTELPGFYSSTHYLDLKKTYPRQLSNMILDKLNSKGFSFKIDFDVFSEPTLLIWRFLKKKIS